MRWLSFQNTITPDVFMTETDATISDETDKRIGLNCFVYYFSMTYTSIIATESIVTICMNFRKAFSGKSFTIRIPSKAPIPITGSIRRFSENGPQLIPWLRKPLPCRARWGALFPEHRFLTFLCTMQPVPGLTIEIRIKFLTFSLFFLFVSILFFICGCKITANLEQYYPLYLRYHSGYLRIRR